MSERVQVPQEPQREEEPVLLTLSEVAKRLRRSEAQLRWMRHNGTGPRSAKLAGRVMYRRGDVERWIDEQFEKAAGPDPAA